MLSEVVTGDSIPKSILRTLPEACVMSYVYAHVRPVQEASSGVPKRMLPASSVGPKNAGCDVATVLHSVTLYTELEQGQVRNTVKHEANIILTYELDFDLQHQNLQVEILQANNPGSYRI